jgi:hypothetical protein
MKRLPGMASCRQAGELLSRRRDTGLSLRGQAALHLHLAICVHCRRFSRQVDFLGRAFREGARREPPA